MAREQCSTAWVFSQRMSTGYRFRLAAEQARTALIFLSQSPCASSCTALSLRCEPVKTRPFSTGGETALFEGQQYTLVRERNRNEVSPFLAKKPPARAEWSTESLWTRYGNVRRPSSPKLRCTGRSATASGAAEATVCPYRRRATGGDRLCGEQSGACWAWKSA